MRSALCKYKFLELKRFLAFLVCYPKDFILQFSSFRRTFKLLGYEKSSICIIGGSDVSLKTLSSLKRSKIKLMALNRYALSDKAPKHVPDYYILVDPHFFQIDNNENKLILEYIAENKIILFIPFKVNALFKVYLNNKNIRYFGIETRFSRWLGLQSPLFPRSTSGMTVILALQLCLYLSKKNIYLIGFLSNIFKFVEVDSDNHVTLKYPSFSSINSKDLNLDMATFFLAQYFFYEDLNRIARRFYRRIFMIGDSYIDTFKRIDSSQEYYE